MITFTSSGSTKRTEKFLDAMIKGDIYDNLDSLAQRGVAALREHTPEDSGLTANSWEYEIVEEDGAFSIWWRNTNRVDGFNVAIGLRHGHATGTGGWVQGYNYIEPALQGVFDDIANKVWEEVTKA